jgi:hypothetical protein
MRCGLDLFTFNLAAFELASTLDNAIVGNFRLAVCARVRVCCPIDSAPFSFR